MKGIAGAQSYNRKIELKAFDDTKAGVKGLVDGGIQNISRMFITSENDLEDSVSTSDGRQFKFPVIDMHDMHINSVRQRIINEMKQASKTWGFFQIVNHGIPTPILDAMLEGVRKFFEQETTTKKQWYTRNIKQPFVYNSNFDLFTAPVTSWRDTFICYIAPISPDPEKLPDICSGVLMSYGEQVMRLGKSLLQLFSEALGFQQNYLEDIGCAEGLAILGHYYPACPEPEQAIGTPKHADNSFITILLQDQVQGLQVLHQDQWVDVPYVADSLIINIGDFMQIISNDMFVSAEHRVRANKIGPRISAASFFTTDRHPSSHIYKPINELLSDENPAKYRAFTVAEFCEHFAAKGLDGRSARSHFKI